MNIQELIKKYPAIQKCIQVYEGETYLNMKSVKKNLVVEEGSELHKDLINFSGYILVDGDYLDLGNNQIING